MDLRHRVKTPVSRLLLAWYRGGHRDLPWRRVSDPYLIWVSEVMLQQTRARVAIPYYQRFIERFPTVAALASAGEEEVLTLWSGLGYYARARNLLRAARQVAAAAGAFPREYDDIRALPGVGDYTAAAIASMAFQLPCAVVDGNVLRVVARVENDAADIASPRTRERSARWRSPGSTPVTPGFSTRPSWSSAPPSVCQASRGAGFARSRRCAAHGKVARSSSCPVKLRKTRPVRIAGALLLVRKGRRILLRQREPGASRMAVLGPAGARRPARRANRAGLRRIPPHHHASPLHFYGAGRRGANGPNSPPVPMVRPSGAYPDSSQYHGSKSAEAGRNPVSLISTAASEIPRAAGRLASCAPGRPRP